MYYSTSKLDVEKIGGVITMNKKYISLCLVLTMIITLSTHSVAKAQVNSDNHAIKIIQALGVMNTDKSSGQRLNSNVTRAEYAQMLVNMSVNKDTVSGKINVSLYKDVPKSHWAAGYIKYAIDNQWMTGYINGTFRPNQNITLQEAINGIIHILGYSNSDFTGNKNSAKMQLYKSMNLNKNITKTGQGNMTRQDCMNLFYNTLIGKNKTGTIYGTVLGYSLDSNGEIHYLELVNEKIEGPIVAEANWNSQIPFSVTNATYYRNGIKVNMSSIQRYDILYYHKELSTIWAYSEKVTGVLKEVSPNKNAPTAIVIAGETYNLEGQKMSYRFSTLGDTKVGDVITVLLGQEDTVVEVLNDTEYSTTIHGVVLETGEKLTEDGNGILYTSTYAMVVDAYGHKMEIEYTGDKNDYTKGEKVIVSYENGGVTVTKDYQRFQNSLSGKVDDKAVKLGAYILANDISIIDFKESEYITIPKSRLAGVTLFSSEILYYSLNPNGEIQSLILDDVTGDMNQYGIITGIDYTLLGAQVQTTYSVILDGVTSNYSMGTDMASSIDTGAASFTIKNNAISDAKNLTGVAITSIDGIEFKNYGQTYLLADEVQVYYLKDSKYQLVKLSNINNLSKFYLTAYYDAPTTYGGRIRVIIARAK